MLTDARNLPTEVLQRLAAANRTDTSPGVDIAITGPGGRGAFRAEQRHRADAELRAETDGDTARHVGYALLYDTPYRVGGKWGWDEEIAQGACDRCLRDDVRYLFNHTGMPLARTVAGTLKLESDKRGLVSDATVDLRQTLAADLTIAIDLGNADQMSFAFRVSKQEWNEDYTHRRILEFEQLFDTSTVTYPANPATVVALARNLDVAQAGADARSRDLRWAAELSASDDSCRTGMVNTETNPIPEG